MSECVLPRSWEDIRAMSFEELCKLPCVEIVDENGSPRERYGMFLMVPTTEFIQAQCDYKGGMSNTNWQLPDEPVVEPAPLYIADPKPVAKQKRKAKR